MLFAWGLFLECTEHILWYKIKFVEIDNIFLRGGSEKEFYHSFVPKYLLSDNELESGIMIYLNLNIELKIQYMRLVIVPVIVLRRN